MVLKPLIRHVHDYNGNLLSTIVGVDKNKIGVSICHPNDKATASKKIGIELATGRAILGVQEEIPNREVVMGNYDAGVFNVTTLADVLEREIYIMNQRVNRRVNVNVDLFDLK